MKSKAVFYYIFYSTKHSKVGFPAQLEYFKSCIDKLQFDDLDITITEKCIYDFPMVEFVVSKTSLMVTK